MPDIFKSLTAWKKHRKNIDDDIGFIPTMGNLHAGHASLIKHSVAENKHTVLSIFVNPAQFNNQDDLKNYPRTLDNDIALAESLGVNDILIPEANELYVDNYRYQIHETKLSDELEGKYRPGHFAGMLTVVMKLLMLVRPRRAYFGEKDFQQLQLVQGMVQAFFLDTDIIACETVRNEQGLALSSRNNRLSSTQYQQALKFPTLLNANKSCEMIKKDLMTAGFKVDYVAEQAGRCLAAVYVDDIRLIDNIQISHDDN
jgi:pantoate--beta-alanine ligase